MPSVYPSNSLPPPTFGNGANATRRTARRRREPVYTQHKLIHTHAVPYVSVILAGGGGAAATAATRSVGANAKWQVNGRRAAGHALAEMVACGQTSGERATGETATIRSMVPVAARVRFFVSECVCFF